MLPKVPTVRGTTYPDREPLVFFCGAPSSIQAWLAMGLSGAFQESAEVEMGYYYMLPVEAVLGNGVSTGPSALISCDRYPIQAGSAAELFVVQVSFFVT